MKERFGTILHRKQSSIFLALILLIATVSVSILVGYKSVKADNSVAIKNIKLTVKNCNVIIKTSDNGKFKYEVDKKIHKLTKKKDGKTMKITLTGITGYTFGDRADMAVIYVPNQKYNKVTVVGNTAGVSIPSLQADFDLTNNQGAMSIHVAKGFKKSIAMTSSQGSGSVVFSSSADNYTLDMKAKNSAVSVAPEMPAFKHQTRYQYVKGTGKAKIRLNIKNSSFSIETLKEES